MFQGAMSMLQRKFDLCSNRAGASAILPSLAFFGIPPKCPTKSSVFCYKGNTILKFKAVEMKFLPFLATTGPALIRLNITFEDGFSCFEAEHSIVKKH